jgi:hypothetical protein
MSAGIPFEPGDIRLPNACGGQEPDWDRITAVGGKLTLMMFNEGGYNQTTCDLDALIAFIRSTSQLRHLLDAERKDEP